MNLSENEELRKFAGGESRRRRTRSGSATCCDKVEEGSMATWLGLVLTTVLRLQQAKRRWRGARRSVPGGESRCGWRKVNTGERKRGYTFAIELQSQMHLKRPLLKIAFAASVNRAAKLRMKRKNLEAGPDSEDSRNLRAQRGGGKQVNRNTGEPQRIQPHGR